MIEHKQTKFSGIKRVSVKLSTELVIEKNILAYRM